MRRAALIFTVLLTIGLIATVLSAWACATWSQPTGSDAIWLAGVRREFFDKAPSAYTSRPSDGLFVALGYYGFGVQFLHVAVDGYKTELLGPSNQSSSRLNLVRAGWPYAAMEGWLEYQRTVFTPAFPPKYHFAIVDKKRVIQADRISVERMIPLRPIWPGFVMNWLFWSLAFGLLWLAVIAGRRFVRHLRRQCGSCGYPVGTSPVCTECGRRVKPMEPRMNTDKHG